MADGWLRSGTDDTCVPKSDQSMGELTVNHLIKCVILFN